MNEQPWTDNFYGIRTNESKEEIEAKRTRKIVSDGENEDFSDSEEFLEPESEIVSSENYAENVNEKLSPATENKTTNGSRKVTAKKIDVAKRPRKQYFDSGVITSIERIRTLLGDSKLYDPDAQTSFTEFENESDWSEKDFVVPALRNVQNYVRKEETSALAAVKEIRQEEVAERLKHIAEYDKDGSLMSLFRIWSLIPPVFKYSADELAQLLSRRVLYNQDDIIAINKPYGLSSQFSASEGGRLAVANVLPKLQPLIAPNSDRLYLMNRLDKCTTGVLLLAASRLRATEIRDMFNEKKIRKTYWALVRNVPKPDEGIIDIPLVKAKIGGRYKTVPVVRPAATPQPFGRVDLPPQDAGKLDKKTPVTEYKVKKLGRKCALVECVTQSGFTHQIRCHLGYGIGNPIVGDHKYTDYMNYLPQRLPADILHLLGIRSAKSREMPLFLHAREDFMQTERGAAILAFAGVSSCWVAKLTITSGRPPRGLEGTKLRQIYRVAVQRGKHQSGRYRYRLDSYFFCVLVDELRHSPVYRARFVDSRCAVSVGSEMVSVIIVRLRDPDRFPLDYKWNDKVQAIVNRRLELEKLMWYLSTLGGAFSALGDIGIEYAQHAGRISWEQLKVAFILGDPIMVARCTLYIAVSYIQTGRLRAAKRIIRQQYRFAISANVADNRQLKNVCLGVWSKLKYAYEMRRMKKTMTNRTS